MSLYETSIAPHGVGGAMSTVLPGPEAASLPTVARIVARAVGQPLTPCAFVPLPGGRTGLGLWRVRLEAPWVAGVLSLVAKVVLVDDRESHLLRWLMSRGRLAPRLYQELPLSARLKVLLLEDVGDCGLPVDWPKQPRVADAVVEWLSRIARLAVPDPLTTTWTDWYRRTTLVREFETAWATIRALQAATPGFIEADEFRLLATLFAGRAIIAQRLQPVCRRFIHGDLEPDHLRAVGEIAIQVRAVDWGLGACGPLAFDLYDLVWGLPDSHFGQSLENLVCLMPSDVRPELTAPVLRLAGGVKAFLHAGRAAAEYLQAPAASGSAATSLGSLRTAVGRLHRWADHFPRGSDLR